MLVRNAKINDPKLRDQALRAAKSVCLNSAYAEFGITRCYAARRIMPHRAWRSSVSAALHSA